MEKEIYISPPLTQLIFRHLASYSVINDSRQFVHLYQAIELLRVVIGEKKIEEHYKKEYVNLNNTLISFGKIVYHINHYFDLLKDTDYKNSNVWKETYRNFLNALSQMPVIHTRIIHFFGFLLDQTPLKNRTIPSDYLAQASKDLISFETEQDMEKKSLNYRKQHFEQELQKLEEGEEKKENDN